MMQTIINYIENDEIDYSYRSGGKTYEHQSGEVIDDEEELNDLVDKYIKDMKVKIAKAKKFKRKVIKHNFPDSYEKYTYLDNLIKNNKFFKYMNNKCSFNNSPNYKRNLWNEQSISDDYCSKYYGAYNCGDANEPLMKLCSSCKKLKDFHQNSSHKD